MPNICEEYIKKWPTIKSPDKDDNPKHLVDSRVCLSCRELFISEWIGNRMCKSCTSKTSRVASEW